MMTAYICDKSWGQALLPLPWRAFFVLLSCVKMLSCRQAAGVLCCQLSGNCRAEKRAESKWVLWASGSAYTCGNSVTGVSDCCVSGVGASWGDEGEHKERWM